MKINYSKEDNNKQVKNIRMKNLTRTAVGALSALLIVGSGLSSVRAQAAEIDLNRESLRDAGYNYFFSGEVPTGIDWNDELKEYWEKGIELAESSSIETEKWEKMGYDFIAEGKVSESMDYDSNIPNKLAMQLDAYQKGIQQALKEGNVVDPNSIKPLDESAGTPTPEQMNLEIYRKMLLEGWVNMGRESVEDLQYFYNKNTNSQYDSYFSQRSMGISASNLINAGRAQKLNEKDIGNKSITISEYKDAISGERMGNIKETLNSISDIVNIDNQKNNDDIEK